MTALERERIAAFAERSVTLAEAEAYLAAPIDEAERDALLDLVRWFTMRYPTPLERLAYVRRAFSRWQRSQAGRST